MTGLPSMERLRASVIINNYNYARFLRAAIDSALSQTYQNCEVVVVDDGSTDNSREVIESYDRRVKAVYKCNGGQGSALNAGFEASSGDLIIFLDADDVLLPCAVETVLTELREGVARIQYLLEVINGSGEASGRYVGGSRVPARLGPFAADSPMSANAFPRQILERIMPIPEKEWAIAADAFLTILSSVLGEVVYLDNALGKYRIHGHNAGGNPDSLVEIRRGILGDFNLHASLHELTRGETGSLEQWLGRYPPHWVGRITSLRESPADHPWDDKLFPLMYRAVSATWRQPYWNLRRRLAYSVWIVGYSLSPKRMAPALRRLERRGSEGLSGLLLGR
jgi:glycosyltransferase involved in cell wall biosynthesis